MLFAPNQEERDLWVNGFYRILRIPIADENFIPMGTPNIEEHKISEESLLELAANDEDDGSVRARRGSGSKGVAR